jgi:hypothetical protein
MPSSLKCVLVIAGQILNFIKARPLNYRLFKSLCNGMGSEYERLILHIKFVGLMIKILMRVFHMSEERAIFLFEK